MDADVGKPERSPVIIAFRADPLGHMPRGGQGPGRSGPVKVGSGSKRVGQVKRTEDGKALRIIVSGRTMQGACRAGHQVTGL